MEITHVGARTRARAMTMVAEETEENSGALKRRKVGSEELRSPSSAFEQTKTLDCETYVNSALEEDTSDSYNASANLKSGGVPASSCSNIGSMGNMKVTDLDEASFEIEAGARYKLNGSESTPTSEFEVKSVELELCTEKSSEMTNSRRAVLSPEKIPSEADLEAFFAAAEEDLDERFKEKYNYDIVNDIPLKGRYDWVQLTPGK
ncbi:hypothetical protein LXL04_013514 [Taraxacum kok-saghyz]